LANPAPTAPAATRGAGRPGPAGSSLSGRHGRGDGNDSSEGEAVIDASEEPEAAATRPTGGGEADSSQVGADDGTATEALRGQLAERTADLQRLQAEYANYRKRVERDRATVREFAVSSVLTELLPALDAIGIARDHGELSGGFKSVADQIQAAVVKLGLVTYGQKGDAFDPKIHEALTHTYSPDVAEDTCVEIFQPGYKVGERILRPARVAVAEPAGEDTN
jgi:molecular chaperone GrpE